MTELTVSDERMVRRLEAFSDIVIGFSLAQLGASLAFTNEFTLDPAGVLGFLYAFAIICSLWYFHHRLFEHSFVPRAVPVVLNFAWLAIVVLLVFVARIIPRHWMDRGVDELYFGLYACAYGILAVQSWFGARAGKPFAQGLYMALWTAVFAVAYLLVLLGPATNVTGTFIWVVFMAGGLGNAVLGRMLRRRAAAAAA